MTLKEILNSLSHYPTDPPLPAPEYSDNRPNGPRVALAVPSMEQHTSNEGHQLMLALRAGGYKLYGRGLNTTYVNHIIESGPAVVVVQDQHEWDSGHLANREEYFHDSTNLALSNNIFRLTVVKDTHRQYESARRYSQAIGCHAWIVYYHPAIVLRTLSWLRSEHLVRTYHTVDADVVPPYRADGRANCLLSGSLGAAYPLRTRIHAANLPDVTFLRHPGYSNTGTHTNTYLQELSKYRVAVCTASKFGYALRKLIEATACGCRVITDLPEEEVLPGIDRNLVRIRPDMDMRDIGHLIRRLSNEYDPAFQSQMAEEAKARYDYRAEGARLANEIERVRRTYR